MPVLKAYRIENDMRVNMIGIGVSGDNTLKALEAPLRKLDSYLVSEVGTDLIALRVGLDEVIILYALARTRHRCSELKWFCFSFS